MQDLVNKFVSEGWPLTLLSKESGVSYNKLYRCKTLGMELKESDIKKLTKYASRVRVSV